MMNVWTLIGKTISAIFMGIVLSAIALLALSHFFPSTTGAQFSAVAISGSLIAGLIGIYVGWRWALDVADEALGKLFELLLLGVGALILAVITFVVKIF